MGAGHAGPMTQSVLGSRKVPHSRQPLAAAAWVPQPCTVMAVRSDPGGPPAGALDVELST